VHICRPQAIIAGVVAAARAARARARQGSVDEDARHGRRNGTHGP